MERKIILFILILFSFGIHQHGESQTTFNKTKYWSGDSLTTLNTIRSSARMDSVIFHAVGIVDSLNYQRLVVVKSDLNGNVIKKRILIDNLHYYFLHTANCLVLSSDSGFIVSAGRVSYSTGVGEGYLIKFNYNLDTMWTLTYNMPDTLAGCQQGDTVVNHFTCVEKTMDGNYIVGGNYNRKCITMNRFGYLLKVNPDGKILWVKAYDDVMWLFDLALTPDSGYVFPGFNNFYTINRTDKHGNILWREQPSYEDHLVSGQIAVNDNNEIISFAPYRYKSTPSPTFYGHMHLVKYNLSGNKLWDKKYETYNRIENYDLHQGFELEILPGGDIVAAGTAFVIHEFATPKGGYKGFLFKFNNQGDSLWSRYYNYGHLSSVCQFHDLLLMDDGGFLALGDHYPYDASYMRGGWLVRTDSLGMAPGAYTLDVEKHTKQIDSKIRLYPNPAYDRVTIISETNNTEKLEIFNNAGKKVYSRELNQKQFKIDVSGWNNGLYYVRITNTKGTFTRKFVVTGKN